ncbi:MAG: hypoxanthine phosphoribosyltransferase [Tissierellia bacterium]|nr:hypoxanthine phosphoribosyltransferase [Tissierellia bacterium]
MKKEKILFHEGEIQEKVKEIADEINGDFGDEEVVIVPLLRGGFIFASDLVRHLKMPVCIDFMTTSSYGSEEESQGNVKIITDLRENIRDKNVIVVDDIMDSGNTMSDIFSILKVRKPKTLSSCVILDKPSRRQVKDMVPDYKGFTIPDVFIVGYGLNYGRLCRNIPYIYTYDE